ncbi:MAG: hypothetical protein ACT6RP_16995, partial [Roseateles sp.]|uniref:hypothetical protein n=1 Tax=Roseateles sp. TaxID=1971397 RepID=UPI0040357B72
MTAPDDDDLRWLAALGGKADADADATREAAWLRAGYRAWDKAAPPEAQPAFDTELALLLARGRAAGLN